MNVQNVENKPKIKKNTKNKIRVDFERAPLKERLKTKFLSFFFLTYTSNKILSEVHFATYTTIVPFHTNMLAICN